jgi:crotonobetainyl-CoA:carnitine CoA-transferase CaiB-like acyl-CoA transferase
MLPLQGIRVIEFCNVAAGPFCGMLLADMGADVIKVEHPKGGDSMRQWPPITGGYSENFASLNRNKRSVTLDLKDPAGPRAGARADARGRRRDREQPSRRHGPARPRLRKPEGNESEARLLLDLRVRAGRSALRGGGFDLTMQAMSGIMSVTGEPGGAPVKCGVPLSDFCAGLYGAYAVAAVLRRVQQGGTGEHVDVSMLGASLAVAALQTSEYFGTGRDPSKLGSAHPRQRPVPGIPREDDYFAMAAGNDSLFKSACDVVGKPELVADPRFGSTTLRAQHQAELKAILEANSRSTAPRTSSSGSRQPVCPAPRSTRTRRSSKIRR